MNRPCTIASLPDEHCRASLTASSTLPMRESTLGGPRTCGGIATVVPQLGLPSDSALPDVGTQNTAVVGHMADSPDSNGQSPQAPQAPADTPQIQQPKHLSQRQRYGESWLRRLRSLPSPVLELCIRRLQYGLSPKEVAGWLMTVPDRGGLQKHAFNTLRLYLQCLRERIFQLDQQRKNRKRAIRRLAKILVEEQTKAGNVISIRAAQQNIENGLSQGIPPPISKKDAMDRAAERLTLSLATTSTREVILLTYEVNKERLRDPLDLEEKMKLPLDTVTRITGKMIEAGNALTREHLAITARMKVNASTSAEDSDNH